MRVYVPTTTDGLRHLLSSGELGPGPVTAFAVTAALREWYVDDDVEELEYAAMLEAARASLRLIGDDTSAVHRRVVVAADVPEADITVRDDLDRGVVRVDGSVLLAQVASVHVDDADAEADVARAAAVIGEADLGSTTAQDVVDDAEGHELAWFASQEIADVLGGL